MRNVISSLFQLILEVLFKLALDAIDKGLRVPKVFFEESLQLRPCDQSGALVVALELSLSEADGAAKEDGSK